MTPSLLLLTNMPILGRVVIRVSKHAPVYRTIVGSAKTHQSMCSSYWGPKDNPPPCPCYGFKMRPSLYAYNRAPKVAPMSALISLHASFYMHIIEYPKTPPSPDMRIFWSSKMPLSVCWCYVLHTYMPLSISLHLDLQRQPSPYAPKWPQSIYPY